MNRKARRADKFKGDKANAVDAPENHLEVGQVNKPQGTQLNKKTIFAFYGFENCSINCGWDKQPRTIETDGGRIQYCTLGWLNRKVRDAVRLIDPTQRLFVDRVVTKETQMRSVLDSARDSMGREKLCRAFWDMRVFGGAPIGGTDGKPTRDKQGRENKKGSKYEFKGITGALQGRNPVSLWPVVLRNDTITCVSESHAKVSEKGVAAGGDDGEHEEKSRYVQRGERNYSHCCVLGCRYILNPHASMDNGVGADDIDLALHALVLWPDKCRTQSANGEILRVFVFDHGNALGGGARDLDIERIVHGAFALKDGKRMPDSLADVCVPDLAKVKSLVEEERARRAKEAGKRAEEIWPGLTVRDIAEEIIP
jgi:hypothetical protein